MLRTMPFLRSFVVAMRSRPAFWSVQVVKVRPGARAPAPESIGGSVGGRNSGHDHARGGTPRWAAPPGADRLPGLPQHPGGLLHPLGRLGPRDPEEVVEAAL